MKSLRSLLFAAAVALGATLHAQPASDTPSTEAVMKGYATDDTGALVEGFRVPTGKSIDFRSGSTLTISGTLNATPTGGTVDLSAVTLTLGPVASGNVTVTDGWTLTSAGSIGLIAGGANENIDFTQGGAGMVRVLSSATNAAQFMVSTTLASNDAFLYISAPAAQNRRLVFQTAGSTRWGVFANNSAEAGSNAGSNFTINAYNDSGVFVDTPLTITRAAGGTITLARPVSISSTLAVSGNTTLTGDLAVNGGDITSSGSLTITPATTLGIGAAPISNAAVLFGANVSSADTNGYGIYGASTAQSTVTGTFAHFFSNPRTQAAAFNLATLTNFRATSASLGSGSSVTNLEGFTVTSGMTQGTNNYGFRGQLAASGTSRWNLYMDGTAPNYIAGEVLIGSTTDAGAYQLQLTDTADADNYIRFNNGSGSETRITIQQETTGATLQATVYSATGNAGMTGRRALGSVASPSTVTDTAILNFFGGAGWDSAAFSGSRGALSITAAGTWTASSHPTRLEFSTTADSSITRTNRWTIEPDGALRAPSTTTPGLQIYNTSSLTDFERVSLLWTGNVASLRVQSGGGGQLRALELRQTQNGIAFTVGANMNPGFDLNYATRSETTVIGARVVGGSTASSGTHYALSVNTTINQTGGSTAANTAVRIVAAETSLGSGEQNLIAAYAGAAGTTERFRVDNTGATYISAGARLSSSSNGLLMISNVGATDFTRLQLGGTTSSFPALVRESTILSAKLADNSGYTPMRSASVHIVDGIATPAADPVVGKIFIDSGDGDLKVIFGDGTVKTIVTDT